MNSAYVRMLTERKNREISRLESSNDVEIKTKVTDRKDTTGFIIRGDSSASVRVKRKLEDLKKTIKKTPYHIYGPGKREYFTKRQGRIFVTGLEHEHKCVIKFKNEISK